jgi:hypothetical protein
MFLTFAGDKIHIMKRILLVIMLSFTLISAQSQQSTIPTTNPDTYMKGDMLLSLDIQAVQMAKPVSDAITWEGVPFRAGFEYLFYNKSKIFLSTGLNAKYLRHQPGDGNNYGVFGLAVPINIHFSLVPRLNTYVGYKIGYSFDGYKPASESTIDGYEGMYSDGYLGVRYFLTPNFAIYSELSADAMRLYGGLSYKF